MIERGTRLAADLRHQLVGLGKATSRTSSLVAAGNRAPDGSMALPSIASGTNGVGSLPPRSWPSERFL